MRLEDPITEVKYISKSYADKLAVLGIFTVKDFITHFPRLYINSSEVTPIEEILADGIEDEEYTFRARVSSFKNIFIRGGGRTMQLVKFQNDGSEILCTFFNQKFLNRVFNLNDEFLVRGKLKKRGKQVQIFPSIYDNLEKKDDSVHLGRIVPEYRLTTGVTKKWFRNRIKQVVDMLANSEITVESELLQAPINKYIEEIHFPSSEEALKDAVESLSIHELVHIHLKIREQNKNKSSKSKIPLDRVDLGKLYIEFQKCLEFELTADQKSVLEDINKILESGELLNELVQGDVGAGKTVIAQYISIVLSRVGYQTVVLTPTTILAKQHFESFSKILKKFNISVQLVTSETKTEKTADVLIGTSAVLARKNMLLKNLGAVVIDEQHRFGVSQREELLSPIIKRSKQYPHFINMTATPIPRTIAETFFSDLRVQSIKTKPKGRIAIKTHVVPEDKRKDSYNWIRNKIVEEGDQIYWICPLVEESEVLEAKAAEATYQELKGLFPEINIGLLHGRMKPVEKQEAMKQFTNGELSVLVSTTVIEVGVDVPNAAIMVIENAERFGLAQLHQIRGRVGRGIKQSYCFLFAGEKLTPMGKDRLEFISVTDNGLEIAEFDLEQRGPGEVYGTRQSGIPDLKIAKLNNLELIKKSKNLAEKAYNNGITSINLFK